MKTNWQIAIFLATMTTIALTGQAALQAEELSYSDLVARISALESDLHSQQVQLVSYDVCTGVPGCGCNTCCKPLPRRWRPRWRPIIC